MHGPVRRGTRGSTTAMGPPARVGSVARRGSGECRGRRRAGAVRRGLAGGCATAAVRSRDRFRRRAGNHDRDPPVSAMDAGGQHRRGEVGGRLRCRRGARGATAAARCGDRRVAHPGEHHWDRPSGVDPLAPRRRASSVAGGAPERCGGARWRVRHARGLGDGTGAWRAGNRGSSRPSWPLPPMRTMGEVSSGAGGRVGALPAWPRRRDRVRRVMVLWRPLRERDPKARPTTREPIGDLGRTAPAWRRRPGDPRFRRSPGPQRPGLRAAWPAVQPAGRRQGRRLGAPRRPHT